MSTKVHKFATGAKSKEMCQFIGPLSRVCFFYFSRGSQLVVGHIYIFLRLPFIPYVLCQTNQADMGTIYLAFLRVVLHFSGDLI